MSNSKGIEQNNEYGISSYDPSQFAISNGILTKYLGKNSIVEVPSIVEQIRSSAFMRCVEVTEIIIPDTVKKIDRYSFVSCAALRIVRIGFGVSVIPMGAFAELPNLESVIVTDSISEIEDFAFRNCKNLGSLEFLTKKYRDPVTAVEKGKAFEMMLAGIPAKIEYTDVLDNVPMLISIGNYAFSGCLSLDVSLFKDNAEHIGISAFDNCFSEINSTDVETESGNGMYSPEDDTYIENNDDIEITPSDIERDEEDYLEDEIDEKEESGYEPQIDEVSPDDQNIVEPVEDKEEIREEFLVSGFIVVNNEIRIEVSQRIIPDAPMESLSLSTRSYHALYRIKKKITEAPHERVMVSDLLKLSPEQLLQVRNMGEKSAEEIIERVSTYLCSDMSDEEKVGTSKQYTIAPDYEVIDGVITHIGSGNIVEDVFIDYIGLGVRATNSLHRGRVVKLSELICLSAQQLKGFPNIGAKSVSEILETVPRYLKTNQTTELQPVASEEQVLAVMHNHEFEFVGLDTILQELPDTTEEDVKEVLTRLAELEKIVQNEDEFVIHHPSFFETVNALSPNNSSQLDERAIRILQQRASGRTLEEVGQQEGATRERIRQIEKKALDKITRRGHIIYDEDQYAYLFSTYAFEKEFYSDYLDESKNIWYYLNFRYTRGKTDTSEAMDDDKLSIATRRAADKYIHRGYIQIDGSYIPVQRGEFENIVAEKYCKDEVTLEKFFEYYEQFLAENEITDERLQLSESAKASRSNRLAESNKILWKQNRCLRYYNIDGSDFTELLEMLNLGQYENIELSTRKFLIDYPDLMKRYDLRDEYEIHNLLKKIHAEKENPQMVFGRMPSIQFGIFDKDSAVREILFAMAPVSLDDLAEMISLKYGTREDTIKANWLNCISEYYHHGMYSVEYEDMPEEHVRKLKEVLVNDFYFMTELRRIYKNLVDNADLSLLSTYNLKKMGFLVGSSYVIQNYATAEAYFEQLLTTDDVVDIAPFSKRYTGLTTYFAYLAGIKHDMRIIEFEPYQYINIRRLEKLGFTKEKLREYGSQVWSYLIDDRYFTIQSIRNDGFESDLDVLGFGDLFYASILKEDGRFSWQRVGNAVVLNPKGDSFTVHDFLVDYITNEDSVNVDDFSHELRERFGIELDRYSIVEKVKGSDVYYDSIMEKLYADYSLYFEEI